MLSLSKTQIYSFEGDILSLAVKNFSEPLRVTIDHPQVVRLRELGPGKYLVILEHIGEAAITFSAGAETVCCQIHVREALVSDPDADFTIYVGDLHAHTSYSDGQLTPYEVFDKVKKEAYFDFFTISDHAELEDDDEFFHTFDAADQYQSEEFTAFAGCESQLDLLTANSIGNVQNNGGEIVTLNTEGYAYASSWEQFWEQIGTNKLGYASIAHPQILGYDVPGVWNGFDLEHATCERSLHLIHGIEALNEVGDCNLINDRVYTLALDCGYKAAPIGASDHHGPNWGKSAERCRTFIYSTGCTKDLFLDALRNARAYACENGNVRLFYTVNGKNPATTLDPAVTNYVFSIHAEAFYEKRTEDDTVFAQIISDHGEVVAEREIGPEESDFTMTVTSDTARFFYLRLYSTVGERTWSAPVWTGRAFDSYPKPAFTKKALNNRSFRTVYRSNGKYPHSIMNDTVDNGSCYYADKPSVEFVFDMGEIYTVSAIGYIAPMLVRHLRESIASFMSRYEYETSMDGITFEPAASGTVLLYGSEHIAEFTPRKARYIRLKALSTVGSETRMERYRHVPVGFGSIRIY